MSNTVVLKAQGLQISPNPIGLPDGGLSDATNVIIKRDNVIESRRGFKLIGNSFGSASDRAKQLLSYKKRILRHFDSTIQFDNTGNFEFLSFNGSFSEPSTGIRIKSFESNGNFYFTTSLGIKKISSSDPSQFTTSSGYVTQAGGVKALDVNSSLKTTLGSQSGFFTQDAAVAYRVVWGINDANKNLILGTPSQRTVVFNSLLGLLLRDNMNVLGALDDVNQSGSLINDGNYVSSLGLSINDSASSLRNNLISLASKIDNDIVYADTAGGTPLALGVASSASVTSNIATVVFNSGDPSTFFTVGSLIFLKGFSAGAAVLNGARTITFVDSTSIKFNVTTANFSQSPVASGSIVSNIFRSLATPADPGTPTTNAELVAVQTYLSDIILALQALPSTVVSTVLSDEFIQILDVTTTATVLLNITVPQEITSNHFYQIYRSTQTVAVGTSVLDTLTPDDELQLVFENFPTSSELSSRTIVVEDITPDAFRGANLYTNATTGEGILQSNDVPPLALDVNVYKNVAFYANTKTRHRESINLLGVTKMISDYNNGTTPTFTVANGTTTNTYKFVTGLKQITQVTCKAGSTLNSSGTASYWLIDSVTNSYYVWYEIGTAVNPFVSGKTGIKVVASSSDTATQIATKTRDTLARSIADFTTSSLSTVVTVTNVEAGKTTAASAGTTTFTFSVTNGRGEDVTTKTILLSIQVSPAKAVEETAKSLVRIINKTNVESIYGYYLSGTTDIPGKMLLEGRILDNTPFYLLGNNDNTGSSFNPDVSPEDTITSITTGNPNTMLITTTNPHGLTNQDFVVITNSNSTPSIDGLYSITFVSTTSFRIAVTTTVAGTQGSIISTKDAVVSQNEVKPNRIYYSKFEQPEAVPILNTIDIGANDKAILRIFPLRDSLFVFKEDGLFRISGDVSPFFTARFDTSCILVAADSVSVANNIIYGWTTQGVSVVSESGVSVISRPIDTVILPTSSASFTNFKTATWGVGYESDNSYYVWTVKNINDTEATIAYRYNNLTNTWTTLDKTNVSGIINPADDKLYLGAGDTNYIEQERKNFDRTDYSDRELSFDLLAGNYFQDKLLFNSVLGLSPGDVVTQSQTVSPYTFNALLQKLDTDPSLTSKNYFSTLKCVGGDNIRTKILALAAKLTSETGDNFSTSIASKNGTITSITATNPAVVTSTSHGLITGRVVNLSGTNSDPSSDGEYQITVIDADRFSINLKVKSPGTTGSFDTVDQDFTDVKTCFNQIIFLLNTSDNISFSNYQLSNTTTVEESVITDVNIFTKFITLNTTLNYLVGPLTIYKAIKSTFTYNPQIMGDPLGYKHLSESTIIFLNKAFTNATLSFSTDLLPAFQDVPIIGDGSGIFGTGTFGNNFFGGSSDSAPFRTIVPRTCQRCRYINLKFTHNVAREKYAIFGATVSGNVSISTRAYR